MSKSKSKKRDIPIDDIGVLHAQPFLSYLLFKPMELKVDGGRDLVVTATPVSHWIEPLPFVWNHDFQRDDTPETFILHDSSILHHGTDIVSGIGIALVDFDSSLSADSFTVRSLETSFVDFQFINSPINSLTFVNPLAPLDTHMEHDAIISGDDTGDLIEDASVSNGLLMVGGILNVNDADMGQAIFQAGTISGTYGAVTINSAGQWTYVANNGQSAIKSLGAGQSLTDTITVESADGTSQVITITINGTNDSAVIGGVDVGSATEDSSVVGGNLIASGTLSVSDVDTGQSTFQAGTIQGTYGSVTIDSAGHWTYSANNAQSGIQSLGAGQSVVDTITVQSADGTSQVITITINGTNDSAVIGGVDVGSVTEDTSVVGGNLIASGTLSVSDVDTGQSTFQAGTIQGTYGSVTIDSGGNWTYSANNAQSGIQSLGAGQSVVDTITVQSADGTPQVLSITINGTNDAAVIGGVDVGSVTDDVNVEDGMLSATGVLSITDADVGQGTFNAGTVQGTYGAVSIDGAGHWTYQVDNNLPAIHELPNGAQMLDTITVSSMDGSSHQIVITIVGANETALIGGVSAGSVTEDVAVSGGMISTSGDLTISDVDTGQNHFIAETLQGDYGSFTIDSVGHWTYTADNSQNAIQSLGTGQMLFDHVHVSAADGTTHIITVTINGTDEVQSFVNTADHGHVTEDSAVNAGVLEVSGDAVAQDLNGNPVSFVAGSHQGAYGNFIIDSSGHWTYQASNSQVAIQSLGAGQTLDETVTVTDAQGNTHNLMVTIHGTNDGAVIGGVDTGSMTEDTGGSAANISSSGTLTISDIDGGQVSFVNLSVQGNYGSLTIDSGGHWTYSANNNQSAIQSLGVGQHVVDTITVHSVDGTAHNISVTINGTNDGAVIGGVSTGSVTEDISVSGGNLVTTGTLTLTDVDAGQSSFQAGTVQGTYGSLSINSAGQWTYSASNAQNAIQSLNAGQQVVDTMTVHSLDGTARTIYVTINGTNEAGVIYGTSGANTLVGNNTNQTFDGLAGNDLIIGDSQEDIAGNTQAGSDTIYGGDGADTIYGDTSKNMNGTADGGHDTLYGDAGNDVISGDSHTFDGNAHGGNDYIDGGLGNDILYGDAVGTMQGSSDGGNDTIYGGDGADIIYGDMGGGDNGHGGNDSLYGGAGNDILYGNSGNDYLDGGSGADSLHGGAGNDTMVFDGADSLIDGGTGTDTVLIHDSFDFSTLNGILNNVEVLDLSAGGNLTMDQAFINGEVGQTYSMQIDGDASSHVTLTNTFQDTGVTQIGGQDYHTYTNGDITLHIEQTVTVVI